MASEAIEKNEGAETEDRAIAIKGDGKKRSRKHSEKEPSKGIGKKRSRRRTSER